MSEIELFGQKVVSVSGKKVEFVEILSRVKTENGYIVPHYFCGEGGLCEEDTKRLLNKFFDHIGRLEAEVPFSFNLEISDLENDRIFEEIRLLVSKSAKRVIVEIIENDYPEKDEEVLVERVEIIKKDGALIALDDFGTKYSNFARLAIGIGPDYIKIDKDVADKFYRNGHAEYIKNLADFGSDGPKTVIEGIDNVLKLDCFERLGFDLFQGYLFSKPFPLTDENLRREIDFEDVAKTAKRYRNELQRRGLA